jgi:hypothetical protein
MSFKSSNVHTGWAVLGSAIALLGIGISAPAASAINLVPQQEGEIQLTGMTCLTGAGNCIELDPSIFDSVVSEIDSSTGTKSYLFVDAKGTSNVYNDTVNDVTFNFGATDLGTTEPADQFWFRPVAVNADGSLMEGGELEVGTFTFDFAKTLSELTLSFFDTEKANGTSFTVYSAGRAPEEFVVEAGPNSNIREFTLSEVEKLTLNLGERYGRTGDGVNFQAVTVPEPSMVVGAIAALIGGGVLRQSRQTASKS